LVLVLGSVVAADDPPHFGPWQAAVNLRPPINTADYAETQPFITKDGLSLYFSVVEGSTATSPQHIWVAKRADVKDPWAPPQKLPLPINSSGNESNAFISVDGHWMFFGSTRTTPDANGLPPFGKNDIYVSHRQNKREDFGPSGWQDPVNLGPGVNSPSGETSPFVFEDDETGVTTLYFQSNRYGSQDIFASTLQPDGTWGQAVRVDELNTASDDQNPTVSRDGLEMYFISNRPGSTPYPLDGCCGQAGQPSPDIWVSTRASTSDPWGPPQNLDAFNASLGGPSINSPFSDGRPSLSFDGKSLYFHSPYRQGNQSIYFDIWMTTRHRVKGSLDGDDFNRDEDSRDDGGYSGHDRR